MRSQLHDGLLDQRKYSSFLLPFFSSLKTIQKYNQNTKATLDEDKTVEATKTTNGLLQNRAYGKTLLFSAHFALVCHTLVLIFACVCVGISKLLTLNIKREKKYFAQIGKEKIHMVRLCNPWGASEWTGPWSESSTEWMSVPKSDRDKKGLDYDDDSEFW